MKSAAGDQNIRRENKLYSYADQMAELELRKVYFLNLLCGTGKWGLGLFSELVFLNFHQQEIEKKKGLKPQEAPKLSKKQEEQLANQKQKETEIRERLRVVSS